MSVEAPPPKSPPTPPPAPPTAGETLIDDRLRHTRGQLRGVDVATGLLVLAIGVIAYLFLLALADHWLLAGGLGRWGRFLAWLALLIAGGGYLYLWIVRPWLRQINPVYVAQTIEQSRPTLKNSLINFLLLRRDRRAAPVAVTRAIEEQAADELTHVSPETVVDRRRVIVLAYVLTGLVALGAMYHVLSPKSPLTSALRVALPWSGVGAPTRVRFDDIRPGDLVTPRGERVVVSAEVHGLREDETAMLCFTTADRQSVDQRVPMTMPPGGYRHEATLPPDSFGLQQDLTYYLAAGDGRSGVFTITVQTAPTILVESVEYDYPDYTGLPNRTVQGQGDLRAIEGTRVTIHARTNASIDWAEIDLGCRRVRGVPMTADDRVATGSFTLRLHRDDPTRPEYDRYQLRFTDTESRENQRPIRHKIEVIADLPPRVELIDPPEEPVQLPVGGVLPLKIRAEDPDFALREVTVRAVLGDRSLPIRPLLRTRPPSPPHQGAFEGVYRFEPARLGLKSGDEVVYWAEAKDNKTPLPGHSETKRRWIMIVEADENQQQDRQQEKQDQQQKQQQDQPQDQPQKQQQDQQEDQQQDQQQDSQQGRGAQDKQQPSEDQQGDAQGQQEQGEGTQGTAQQDKTDQQDQTGRSQTDATGQDQGARQEEGGPQDQSDQPSEPIDGEANPGDVIEKVLQQREQEQQAKGQQQEPGQEGPGQTQPSQPPDAGDRQELGQQQPEPRQEPGGGKEPGQSEARPETGPRKPGSQEPSPDDAQQAKPGQSPEGGRPRKDDKQAAGPKSEGPQQESPAAQGEDRKICDKCGKPQSECECSGRPKQGPGQSNVPEGAAGAGDNTDAQQGGASSKQPGQGATGSQPDQGERPAGDQARPEGDRAAGKHVDKQPRDSAGGQPGQKEEQTGGRPSEQTQAERAGRPSHAEPSGAGSDRSPDTDKPRQADQAEGSEGGRPLAPEEIDPNVTGEPKGQTDKAPNAQAKRPRAPGGGGRPGAELPPPAGKEPGEDPFNRQYAKRQTILALEYLKDQLAKEKPNQKLLDSLGGWTRDDLEKFTRRWEAMFRQTRQQGAEGQKAQARLDEALKSLGLRRTPVELRGGTTKDQLRRLRQPRRIEPPPEWAEQTRAYHRSVGRDE